MQGAGWKLTALAASVAVGFVVLMQVQQNLKPQQQTTQSENREENLSEADQLTSHLKSQNSDVIPGHSDRSEPFAVREPSAANNTAPAKFAPNSYVAGNTPPGKNVAQPSPAPHSFEPDQPKRLDPFGFPEAKPTPPTKPAKGFDPFAVATSNLNQKIEEKKGQFNQFASDVNARVNNEVAKVDNQVDQWGSAVTQASNNVRHEVEGKVKLVTGAFPEVAPLAAAVHEAVVPAAGEKKSSSQQLIELTQNLTSRIPAPSFGNAPVEAEKAPTTKVVPASQPTLLAPAVSAAEKPFFDTFAETPKKTESKPDEPYRIVPEFNPTKPLPGTKREPAPLRFNAESDPVTTPDASNDSPAFPLTTSQTPSGGGSTAITKTDPDLLGTARVDMKIPERVLQPKIELYKSAPKNAVLGQPLVYTIEIENTGVVAVKEVTVEDKFPAGSKLTGTIPRAELVEKKLIWKFEELSPGERKKILVRVVPLEAGSIGSISTVTYKSVIAAQTLVTAPKLNLLLTASEQVAIGETAQLRFVAHNDGDGDAQDVVLRNLIPAGFEHPAGADLEYDLGTIKAGGKKEITLQLNAKKEGTFENVASIQAVGGFKADATFSTEVIPSVLSIVRNSPTRRFVGHAMKQTTTAKNHSNRLLNNVTIIEHVPAGFRFKKASNNGLYSNALRTVTWTVPRLPAGENVQVSSELIPTTIGTQTVKVKALDASGHQAEVDSAIKVEGFSSLAVRVPDARGPVVRGERVSIRFKVINRGSAQASRVLVSCKIPEQLEYVSSNGPVKATANGQFVQFQAIGNLGPNQEATFDLVFTSTKSGDGNIEFEVTSDQTSSPLKHHEQVVVYGD